MTEPLSTFLSDFAKERYRGFGSSRRKMVVMRIVAVPAGLIASALSKVRASEEQ